MSSEIGPSSGEDRALEDEFAGQNGLADGAFNSFMELSSAIACEDLSDLTLIPPYEECVRRGYPDNEALAETLIRRSNPKAVRDFDAIVAEFNADCDRMKNENDIEAAQEFLARILGLKHPEKQVPRRGTYRLYGFLRETFSRIANRLVSDQWMPQDPNELSHFFSRSGWGTDGSGRKPDDMVFVWIHVEQPQTWRASEVWVTGFSLNLQKTEYGTGWNVTTEMVS